MRCFDEKFGSNEIQSSFNEKFQLIYNFSTLENVSS